MIAFLLTQQKQMPVSETLGVRATGVEFKESAQQSLGVIDNAIKNISDIRADFGSIQSRLNATVQNINTSIENLSASNSRIRDADIAEESSELAKKNIMLQARNFGFGPSKSATGTCFEPFEQGLVKVEDSLLSASDDADGEISCEEEEPGAWST